MMIFFKFASSTDRKTSDKLATLISNIALSLRLCERSQAKHHSHPLHAECGNLFILTYVLCDGVRVDMCICMQARLEISALRVISFFWKTQNSFGPQGSYKKSKKQINKKLILILIRMGIKTKSRALSPIQYSHGRQRYLRSLGPRRGR